MLPAPRTPALSQAIEYLDHEADGPEPAPRIRVYTLDGSILQGEVQGAGEGHITLLLDEDESLHDVAAANIDAIHLAVPDRRKEWLLGVGGIVGGAAGVTALVLLWPDRFWRDATAAFGIVFIIGAAGLRFMMRTRFRRWVSRWEPWFRGEP